jgi:murein L,D-transpeptidase YafK
MNKISKLIPGLLLIASTSAMADMCSYEKQFQSLSALEQGSFKDFWHWDHSADQILISKSKRRMYLFKGTKVLKSYPIAFGNPHGPKRFEGDRKTPEGLYYIESKNPYSAYHLSLKISYPNANDIAFAKKYGKSPGNNIMIHGFPNKPAAHERVRRIHPLNWTLGCLATTDQEIEEIYSFIAVKTPVTICPE